MTHPLRCTCGKLKGKLNQTKEIHRTICYCTDCQAFAHFLKREHDILDEIGGTTILQTLPKHITFIEGTENLACIRLTDTGLLRWYTTCCNTPIGNTLSKNEIPFIGLIPNCVDLEQASLNKVFGPVRRTVSTQEAIGEPKPKAIGGGINKFRVVYMSYRSMMDGSYMQNPFFVLETGNPIVTPQVLNHMTT
jgi:hypothetical protein